MNTPIENSPAQVGKILITPEDLSDFRAGLRSRKLELPAGIGILLQSADKPLGEILPGDIVDDLREKGFETFLNRRVMPMTISKIRDERNVYTIRGFIVPYLLADPQAEGPTAIDENVTLDHGAKFHFKAARIGGPFTLELSFEQPQRQSADLPEVYELV